MRTWDGRTCPYCLSTLTAGEDVVTCTACGMPQHRQCWEANHQCVTPGCQGRPGYGSASSRPSGPVVITPAELGLGGSRPYCPVCGAPNSPNAQFCTTCGRSLDGASSGSQPVPAYPPVRRAAPPAGTGLTLGERLAIIFGTIFLSSYVNPVLVVTALYFALKGSYPVKARQVASMGWWTLGIAAALLFLIGGY